MTEPSTPQDHTRTRAGTLLGSGALLAITLAGAALRFLDLQRAGLGSLFYASAVRSMGLSVHNFFFAAYDPLATFMVDKPPLALWLQTLSAQALGYSGFSIIAPMALASTLAVPLLCAASRPVLGRNGALVAALFLAVFPESVATARDSTMDALMMALLVLAAVCLQRAVIRGSRPWLLAWAATMGLVFNVKFFEGFVALPAFLLYAFLRWPGPLSARLRWGALAVLVLVAVSLSWAAAVELAPRDARPRVMNDPDNSVFGLITRYNGLDRVLHREVVIFSPVPGSDAPGGLSPAARRFGVGDAGPLRMLTRANGPLLGITTVLAIAGGVLLLRRRGWLSGPALLWVAWAGTGIIGFSFANRAPAHYVEAFAPALAVLAAFALCRIWESARSRSGRWVGAMLLLSAYGAAVALSFSDIRPGSATVGLLVAAATIASRLPFLRDRKAGPFLARASTAGLLGFLVVPSVWIAAYAPRGGQVTVPNPIFYAAERATPPRQRRVPVEAALAWTTEGPSTRYALAIDGFNNAGEAIAVSGAPVLPFWNEYLRQPLFSTNELQHMVRNDEVRYFLVSRRRLNTLLAEYRTWLREECQDKSKAALLPLTWTLWDCAPPS